MDEEERLERWKVNRKVRINRSFKVWKTVSESDVTSDEVGDSDGDDIKVIEATNDNVNIEDNSEDFIPQAEADDKDGNSTVMNEDTRIDDVALVKRENGERNDEDVDTDGSDDEEFQSLDEDDEDDNTKGSDDDDNDGNSDVLTDLDNKEIYMNEDTLLQSRGNFETSENDDEPVENVETDEITAVNGERDSDNEDILLQTEQIDDQKETDSVNEDANQNEDDISKDCYRNNNEENYDTGRIYRSSVTRSAPPIPNFELEPSASEESTSDDGLVLNNSVQDEEVNDGNVKAKDDFSSHNDMQENMKSDSIQSISRSVSEPDYGFTFNDPLEDLNAWLEEKRSSKNIAADGQTLKPSYVTLENENEEEYSEFRTEEYDQNIFADSQMVRPYDVPPEKEKEEEYAELEEFNQNIVTDSLMVRTCNEPQEKEKVEENLKLEDVHFEDQALNTRALPKNATTYKLEMFERNALIIFNFENINGYKPRLGTREDAEALTNTFGYYGFEIEEHVDLCRDEIFREIKRFSEQDFTDYGCLAVAILTHGSDMGALKAKDRSFYEMDIINYFKSQGRPTLVTKPKIIIIQACRGSKTTRAVHVMRAGKISTDHEDSGLQHYTLPVEADTLVLHSTYVGNTSHRDETHGSWLIQTLCRKINELAKTQDLETIITEVKREVAIDKVHEEYNRRTLEIDYNKQMPVVTSTLIRKLYLKKYGDEVSETSTADTDTSIAEDTMLDRSCNSISRSASADLGKFAPCVCFLDRFEYLRNCMRYFVEDNPEDETARSFLDVAEVLHEGPEFNVAKEKISRAIRHHFQNNAKDFDYYKYLYFFKD